MKRAKKLPVPPRGNEEKKEARYGFLPEVTNITTGELAQILAFCGLSISEKVLEQLPSGTKRHFKIIE